MDRKAEFVTLFTTHIHREGAEKLLDYLQSPASDFFTAPASTRYHLAVEGGLVEHSLNVYNALRDYLSRPRAKIEYNLVFSDETIAIVGLLHDVCKLNVYQKSTRNVKDKNGNWTAVPTYDYNDQLPYGHGEKSVYILSGFMKLTREEAFAIRYHMGFAAEGEKSNVSQAFEQFPLSLALSIADLESTYFFEARR
jgi:hypothetical protein